MKRITIALILLFLGTGAMAASSGGGLYSGVNILRGTVVSVGRLDPVENIGSGVFFDINYTSVAANFGIANKHFGDSPVRTGGSCDNCPADGEVVTNAYFGVGLSRILQFQYGYGNEGDVLRVRSDFNFRAVVDFLTGHRTRKDRMLLADRLTFTFAGENYNDQESEEFDNITWGFGLLF